MECTHCGREVPEGGRFCPFCGRPVREERGQLIPVSVLYVDLAGYTRLVQTRTPEEVGEITDRFFSLLEEEVTRVGGMLYQKLGDGGLCLFGYPRTLEDAAHRALLACCRVRERLGELGEEEVRIHGGVASGKVLRVPGKDVRFVGTPMNLAARLQDLTPPGEFWVDETTYRLTRHAFEIESVGAVEIPGLGLHRVYRLIGIKQSGRAWRRLVEEHGAFVGRERELLNLLAVWERFHRQPRPLMVRILGEPGVGKTRLLVEFLRALPPERVLIARALPFGMPPFGPLIYALRRASLETGRGVEDLAQASPGVLHRMREEREMALPPEGEEAQRFFLHLFRSLMDRPTVMILEDAQWADAHTFRVLRELMRQDVPMLLILNGRTPLPGEVFWRQMLEELEREFPAVVLRLRPLSAEDVRVWWEMTWGETPSDGEIRQVLERTGGIPLFLEEYARYVRRFGKEDVPLRLEEILLAQLAHFPPRSREILECASLMGQIFFQEPLLRALDLPEEVFERAMEPLVEHQMVVRRTVRQHPDWQEYAFRHVLLQEAVFQSVPTNRRKAYAGKLYRVFQEVTVPTLQHTQLLARFALWAQAWDEAYHWMEKTVETLIPLGAWRTLLDFLEGMEEVEEHLEASRRRRILEAKAQALIHLGQHARAREILQQARAIAGESPRMGLMEAQILQRESRYGEALRVLRGIRTTRVEEERRRLEEMLWVAHLMGDRDEVERLWRRYVALPLPDTPADRAHRLNLRANVLPSVRVKTRIALYREVLDLALAHGLSGLEQAARNNLVELASRGRIQEALDHLERAVDLARQQGDRLGEAISTYNVAEILTSVGAYEAARQWLDRYMSLSMEIHNRLAFVYGHWLRALIAWDEGKGEEAMEAFSQASTWAWRLKSRGLRAHVHYDFSRFLMERGEEAGRRLARWSWGAWEPYMRAFFRWRWEGEGDVGDVLAACPPHLPWDVWLDLFRAFVEADSRWRRRLTWKGKRILAFVRRNTPRAFRPFIDTHPRYRVFAT